MSIHKYLDEMRRIQSKLLDFIETGNKSEENYQNLKDIFDEINIRNNQHELKSLFYLITKISNNHHREEHFFDKIERILISFKDEINQYFSNSEIFNIFRSNKRILLFLLEANLMIMDEHIAKKITTTKKYINAKYPQYFSPEIRPFIKEEWFPKYMEKNGKIPLIEEINKELPENFYEKRKIGQNDNQICKIIQKDSIEDFIVFVNKNSYPLDTFLELSIYETNSFLVSKEYVSLIQYALFFGSIQIFNYLRKNKVEILSFFWSYAIHGQNEEIIHILEENNIPIYEKSIKLSIKCHNIGMTNYLLENYSDVDKPYNFSIDGIKYYNFEFIQNDSINESSFGYLCEYDYYTIVNTLLKEINIDINKIMVLMIYMFFMRFKKLNVF